MSRGTGSCVSNLPLELPALPVLVEDASEKALVGAFDGSDHGSRAVNQAARDHHPVVGLRDDALQGQPGRFQAIERSQELAERARVQDRGFGLNALVAVRARATVRRAAKGIRAKKRVPVGAFDSDSKADRCR